MEAAREHINSSNNPQRLSELERQRWHDHERLDGESPSRIDEIHRRTSAMYYLTQRTITTLNGIYRLTLHVRRCRNQQCEQYHRAYRPEEEGRWALPHGEFGLDVIALIGSLRSTSQRSVPEIHQALCDRGISIAESTVTHLLQRYEELVSLRLSDQQRLHEQLKQQGQVILALDGLQPDVGHEFLWVVRDCLSGEILLARSLLSACSGSELCPTDLTQWRALQSKLNQRQEARRMQHRFRKAPESYLMALEEKLIKERLPT